MEQNYGEASLARKIYVKLISDNDLWIILGRSSNSDQKEINRALDDLKNKYFEQFPSLRDDNAPFSKALEDASKELAPLR